MAPKRSTARPRRVRRSPTPAAQPILEAHDVRRILLDTAVRLAPADLVTLMGHERDLRERSAHLEVPTLGLFRDQLNLALDCLHDHVAGNCPQIPYYTIAVVGAAVFYFADRLDVVPDFLPRIGELDDAAVMAMACHLAIDGLRRYCTWKSRSTAPLDDLPQLPTAHGSHVAG